MPWDAQADEHHSVSIANLLHSSSQLNHTQRHTQNFVLRALRTIVQESGATFLVIKFFVAGFSSPLSRPWYTRFKV
jgi:Na+/alanine symporter